LSVCAQADYYNVRSLEDAIKLLSRLEREHEKGIITTRGGLEIFDDGRWKAPHQGGAERDPSNCRSDEQRRVKIKSGLFGNIEG